MKLTNVITWFVILPLTLFFTACGRQEEKPPPVKAEKKLNVVTTVAPITSIVENVAGDKVRLTGIIPEGINSHTFEPVPSDVKILAAADLLIVNGLDLEIPTLKLARANMKQEAAVLRLGDKTITEKEYIYDFSFPKDHGHPNPHLWLNPEHAMRYATLVRDELIRLDPENKGAYDSNTAAFLEETRSPRPSDKRSDQDDPGGQPPAADLSRFVALFRPALRLSNHRRRPALRFFGSEPKRGQTIDRSNQKGKNSRGLRLGGFSQPGVGTDRARRKKPLY